MNLIEWTNFHPPEKLDTILKKSWMRSLRRITLVICVHKNTSVFIIDNAGQADLEGENEVERIRATLKSQQVFPMVSRDIPVLLVVHSF